MTAATALAAAWIGRMPMESDQNTVRIFAFLIFFACLGIVMFGGKIYNALEKAQLFMVIWIIGYLVIVDLFLVPPRIWWTVIKGFFSFGHCHQMYGEGNLTGCYSVRSLLMREVGV